MSRFHLVGLACLAAAAVCGTAGPSQAGFWEWKHCHCGPKHAPRGEVAAVVPAVMRSGPAVEISPKDLERALAKQRTEEAAAADDDLTQRLEKLEGNVEKLTDLVTRLANAVEKLEATQSTKQK